MAVLAFEDVASKLKLILQQSANISYCPDDAIIICDTTSKETVPEFSSYLIKISPVDSGFVNNIPKIGNLFRTLYTVAIELWVKSYAKTERRLLSGNFKANKGVWDFYQDIYKTLEHNTLGLLQPYAGSNITKPIMLSSAERQIEGVGFIWTGNQFNTL